MSRQPHKEWYDEVSEVRSQLESSPDNLDLATQFWTLIGGSRGYDIRDGKRVISTFRAAAVRSDEGLAALLSAFRQLANDTGEYPRRVLFDPPLESYVRLAAQQPDPSVSEDAIWLVRLLDLDE